MVTYRPSARSVAAGRASGLGVETAAVLATAMRKAKARAEYFIFRMGEMIVVRDGYDGVDEAVVLKTKAGGAWFICTFGMHN
jgi:hypothetical protein